MFYTSNISNFYKIYENNKYLLLTVCVCVCVCTIVPLNYQDPFGVAGKISALFIISGNSANGHAPHSPIPSRDTVN